MNVKTAPNRAMRRYDHKNFGLTEVKAIDDAQGIFEGYLSVFGNLDDNGDICEPGCFKKTLREAYEVKTRLGSNFLYPLLWMHDPNNPVGGFTDMREDAKGLFVRGQCDLTTEWGRRAFSGMKMGYMSQMSIGYQTVKATRDQKGLRHLSELRLIEGSTITTGFAANPEANILATKASQRNGVSTGVSGKTAWPLSLPSVSYDAPAASQRLVAWATDSDNVLDIERMRSVHLYVDPASPELPSSYRYPFCDVIDGNVVAVPSALESAAENVTKDNAITRTVARGMKRRLATYYKRMSKQFNDPGILVPWDSERRAWKEAVESKQMGGLQCVTSCLSSVDYLGDNIDMLLEMIGDATGLNLDPDEGAEDDEDSTPMSSSVIEGMGVMQAVRILLDNLPGFQDALLALGDAFQVFDDATDTVLELLGMNDTDSESGYMRAAPVLDTKASRALSAANRTAIKSAIDGIHTHTGKLNNLLDTTDKKTTTIASMKSEPRATTSSDTPKPDNADESTLETGLSDLLLAAKMATLRYSV